MMMKTIHLGKFNYASSLWTLNRPWVRSIHKEFFSTLPARQTVMQFSDTFFQTTNDAVNACEDIGLAFNCFDPNEGMEIIHLIDKAKILLDKQAGMRSSYRSRTLYKDIIPNYVGNGLWI